MVALAAVHLFIIVAHNFCYYVYGGAIRKQIVSIIAILAGHFISLLNRLQIGQKPDIELQEKPLHAIPEVTFNYCEYREPLVGVDK